MQGLVLSSQLNMFQCSRDLEPSEFGESNSGERGEGSEVDPSEREPTLHFPKSHAQVTTREYWWSGSEKELGVGADWWGLLQARELWPSEEP